VVALIIFLPAAQTSIVTVATTFGGEPEVRGFNEDGLVQSPTNITALDAIPSFRWLDSGSSVYAACTPEWSLTNTDVGDYYGSGLMATSTNGSCDTNPQNQEVKGEFNGAYWVEHGGAVEEGAPVMEAGSNNFVFDIVDKGQDFSNDIPTTFAYEMWSASVGLPSTYQNDIVGFEYEVSLVIIEYVETFNGFPVFRYFYTDVMPAVWTGTYSYENCGDITGAGCVKAWFELVHVLNGAELNQWKDEVTPLIDSDAQYPTLIGFRIHIDNVRDITRGLRISSSPMPLPWETELSSSGPSFNPVYSTYWVNTQSVETISQATKVTVGGMGLILMMGALASTPLWNPFMATLNDRINSPQTGGVRRA
jgi:hypothetical protein